MNAQRKVVYLHPDRVDEEGHPRTIMGQKFKTGIVYIYNITLFSIKAILICLLFLFKPFVGLIALMSYILFAITIIAGFIVGAENFPRWEMLVLSVGMFMFGVMYVGLLEKIQK